MFVTSAEYSGNLGTLTGADAKCLTAAMSAGLPGLAWMAWLSDGMNQDPDKRFMYKAPKGYVRTDGVKVADSWSDLVDGSLDAPINRYENGMPADANAEDEVWTNTNANGTRKGNNNCMGWISNSMQQNGHRGQWTQTDSKWTDNINGNCEGTQRLICFQQ